MIRGERHTGCWHNRQKKTQGKTRRRAAEQAAPGRRRRRREEGRERRGAPAARARGRARARARWGPRPSPAPPGPVRSSNGALFERGAFDHVQNAFAKPPCFCVAQYAVQACESTRKAGEKQAKACRKKTARQDVRDEGEEVSQRLPAAGFRHAQHVSARQHSRQRLRLHRRGRLEAALLEVAEEGGVEAALPEAGDGGRGGALAGDADVQGRAPGGHGGG